MKLSISCVLDKTEKLYRQFILWNQSLNLIDPDRIMQRVVFHVGNIPSIVAEFAKQNQVELVEVAPFGLAVSPFCNKLQQLQHLARSDADHLIMTDVDIVFMASPTRLVQPGKCRAKIVDLPNPPGDKLQLLLQKSGISDVTLDGRPDFAPGHRTHQYNCNGGLYILPRSYLDLIRECWIKWVMFCSEQAGLLQEYTAHVDQLGFMLAMIELELPFDPLPAEDNFPIHFQGETYAQWRPAEIRALHYHHRIDADGKLLPTGAPAVDSWIDRANRALAISRNVYCQFDALEDA